MHQSTFKIRTFHTDAFGHVNNARHLEILEEARWQYAEDIGLMPMLRAEELGFIIMDMRVRFREPVLEGKPGERLHGIGDPRIGQWRSQTVDAQG